MLRPVVPNWCAIELRLSPALTEYTRKVGAGVGVGRTNARDATGALSALDGAAEDATSCVARGPPIPRSAAGRHAASVRPTTTTSGSATRVGGRGVTTSGSRRRWRGGVEVEGFDRWIRGPDGLRDVDRGRRLEGEVGSDS